MIIDDDDDFKPKGKGGARGGAKEAKRGSQEGTKRKRTRARIEESGKKCTVAFSTLGGCSVSTSWISLVPRATPPGKVGWAWVRGYS